MIDLQQVTSDIVFFNVPYKDIFVGIYVVQTEKGTVLFDAAGCDQDVDAYILPALQQLGVKPTHVFISHNHADHAGGLARFAALFPDAVILSRNSKVQQSFANVHCPQDGETLLDVLQVVTIPGHTPDAAALLDRRTGTLICGDCLQSYGIYGSGEWYGAIGCPVEHLEAIAKLREMEMDIVATAHDYHPCGMISRGREAIAARLDNCIRALERVYQIAAEHPQMDEQQVADLCNDGTLPKVAARIVRALRQAAEEGRLTF